MKFCRNCGQELEGNATFCASCGAKQVAKTKYCQNCGSELADTQDICSSCGTIQRKDAGIVARNVAESRKIVNTTVATIVGYFIPGLPSILWLGQKTKGIVMVLVTILLLFIFPVGGNILFGILGAIDAYKLSIRVNEGERLEEWGFFWK